MFSMFCRFCSQVIAIFIPNSAKENEPSILPARDAWKTRGGRLCPLKTGFLAGSLGWRFHYFSRSKGCVRRTIVPVRTKMCDFARRHPVRIEAVVKDGAVIEALATNQTPSETADAIHRASWLGAAGRQAHAARC